MSKILYDYKRLNNYVPDNNIKLKYDYESIKLNKNSIIEGNCSSFCCSHEFKKTFCYLIRYGAYCKNCTKVNRNLNYKNTCIKKYGVDNLFQSEKIKETIKSTNLQKYGVENPTYSNEIRKKTQDTCILKYGVNSTILLPETIKKRKEACLNKYGNEVPLKTELGKETIKQTCIKKYGFEYPSQNPEIAEKSSKNSYRKKEYILPSGNTIFCQGYEPFALDKLIKNDNVNETDIVTGCKNVPTIWYNDENEKKHRHYVDIFIPSQNRCIEVKSTWTAKKNEDNIYLKQNAAKELGYKYEIWIYNNKKELVETHL
jgi:hypothetical protein